MKHLTYILTPFNTKCKGEKIVLINLTSARIVNTNKSDFLFGWIILLHRDNILNFYKIKKKYNKLTNFIFL